jgi:hypothetical protein
MMVVVAEADVGGPAAVKERLEVFAGEVLGEAMNRPVQVVNGGLYLRGLIEQGPRKSLEPMVARLGGQADYQSLQQFVADSPWDPAAVVRAVAERVAPEIGVEAWVLDDTGFVKDGKRSPGVKRQYSGTMGKIGNLPDRCLGARGRAARHGPVGLGAVSARGVVRGPRAPPAGEDPRGGVVQDQAPAGR